MTIYTIYLATNVVNGKQYVGFDSAWPRRKNSHLTSAFSKSPKQYKQHFHDAIKKHGRENFTWEVIYQSLELDHTLSVMEHHFISQYRTYVGYSDCNGYNLTLGGEGQKGRLMSDETKRKKSVALKGKPSPQSRPIVTPFGVFAGLTTASTELNIPTRTIACRIRSKNPEWYYQGYPKEPSVTQIRTGSSRQCSTPFGLFDSVRECSNISGLPESTIHDRCNSNHFNEWCFTGVQTKHGVRSIITPHGQFISTREASRVLKINPSTIQAHLRSKHKPDWSYTK